MNGEERPTEVPAFYRKLQEPEIYYRFDGSPEAWLWKELLDLREDTLLETAAMIIEAYTRLGSYSPTGEDFYVIPSFMGELGWALSETAQEEVGRLLASNRPQIERREHRIRSERLKQQ